MLFLYQIPRGSKIKTKDGFMVFHHTDGYREVLLTCDWIEPGKPNIINLPHKTRVREVGSYYEIIEEKDGA